MSPGPRVRTSLILGARVLLLLGAVAAVLTAVVLGRRADLGGNGRAVGASGGADDAPTYACPMHPEVTGSSPTGCPICGMALEPVRARLRTGGAETFTVAGAAQSRLFFDVTFAKVRPMTREMAAPAWIDGAGVGVAIFYDDEIALLEEHEAGVFQGSADAPGTTAPRAIRVRLTGEPPSPRDRSTSAVRFRIDGASPDDAAARNIGVGTVGWIKFPTRSREMLAVPYPAVVQSPAGPYVLIASADRHTFTRRPIKIGRVLFAYAAVLDGVREGERVVAMNTFFLDSERRFGPRSEGAPEATP